MGQLGHGQKLDPSTERIEWCFQIVTCGLNPYFVFYVLFVAYYTDIIQGIQGV